MEEMCTKQFFIKFEKEIYMSYSKKTLLTENSILEKTIFQFYVKKCFCNIKKKKKISKKECVHLHSQCIISTDFSCC